MGGEPTTEKEWNALGVVVHKDFFEDTSGTLRILPSLFDRRTPTSGDSIRPLPFDPRLALAGHPRNLPDSKSPPEAGLDCPD
jgi:hypothetical protein